jgi:diguanylate cyclase (GGDEF)-like protein/PAS domain S-box-containing protein
MDGTGWKRLTEAGRGQIIAALILGATFFTVAYTALAITRWSTDLASIWPPNAIVLFYLLTAPRQRWPLPIAAVWLSGTLANWLAGGMPLPLSAIYGVANCIEALVVATSLGAWNHRRVDLESLGDLSRFVVGTTLGSAAGATIATAATSLFLPTDISEVWSSWFVSTLLGMLIVAPILLIGWSSLGQVRALSRRDSIEGSAALVLVGLVGAFVFAQDRWSLFFVLQPPMLVVTFRLRGLGAALSTLVLAAIGTAAAVLGTGPFAQLDGGFSERIALLQLFLAVTVLTALPTAAVLAERDRFSDRLQDSEAQFRTVVDAVSDVIFRTDERGRWTFLNPAWETLTGYSLDDSIGQSFLHHVVHEDREEALSRVRGLSSGLFDSVRCQVRYRRSDGGERWAEVLTHRLLDDRGEVIGTAGTIVDISDRVALAAHAEEARRRAEREAQAALLLAATDELTGLSSRRALLGMLEQLLDPSRDGSRDVAIALFDIDHFKQVNDRFGHLAGDEVLQSVAKLARRSVRDGDLVGRLGGEEFAILMPGASMAQAVAVGERLRSACAAAIHPACPGRMVTVSVGVATASPGSTTTSLLREADEALYRAKNAGRNCLRIAA